MTGQANRDQNGSDPRKVGATPDVTFRTTWPSSGNHAEMAGLCPYPFPYQIWFDGDAMGMRSADMRRAEMPPPTAATHATNRPPTTPHGLPGRNSWPGWGRSFRWSARGAAVPLAGLSFDDAMIMEVHASGFRAHFHPPFKPQCKVSSTLSRPWKTSRLNSRPNCSSSWPSGCGVSKPHSRNRESSRKNNCSYGSTKMSVRWNGFEPDREAIHRFECRTRGLRTATRRFACDCQRCGGQRLGTCLKRVFGGRGDSQPRQTSGKRRSRVAERRKPTSAGSGCLDE